MGVTFAAKKCLIGLGLFILAVASLYLISGVNNKVRLKKVTNTAWECGTVKTFSSLYCLFIRTTNRTMYASRNNSSTFLSGEGEKTASTPTWAATKHQLTTATSSIKTQTTARQQFDCLLQHNKKSEFYVTVNAGDYCNEARLGNKMFMVAAAISIACRNNASLVLLEDTPRCGWTGHLQKVFERLKNARVIKQSQSATWAKIKQEPYMSYQHYNISASTTISGFFQNRKYLSDAEQVIRQAFQFSDSYAKHSEKVLHRASEKFAKVTSPILVGVHIRLGDMKKPEIIKCGYTMTNSTFYEQAFRHMGHLHEVERLIFVVSSDTISDARKMLASLSKRYNIYYMEGGSPEEDMCALSNTHHMITSGGTFGFWPAWFVNGTVIYFSGYARPGSTLEKIGYCRECLNLPTWTPLGNSHVII